MAACAGLGPRIGALGPFFIFFCFTIECFQMPDLRLYTYGLDSVT